MEKDTPTVNSLVKTSFEAGRMYERDNMSFDNPEARLLGFFDLNLDINLLFYSNTCGDGCCTDYGAIVKVNGVSMPWHNEDAATILKQVLEHLGYSVSITEDYE